MCRSAGVAAARAAVMMMMGAEPGGEAVAPAEPPECMHMHTPVSALPGLTVRTREPAAEEEVEHTVGGYGEAQEHGGRLDAGWSSLGRLHTVVAVV